MVFGMMRLGYLLLRIRLFFWALVYRAYAKRYQVARSFQFNGPGINLFGEGEILLGEESYIGEHSSVQASAGFRVQVGRRCRISHNVRIYTMTADPDTDFRNSEGAPVLGDVTIGDGVWIGVNVYIGPGVKIGDNTVVGANSVVVRDVPPGEIWGGVPARRIRAKGQGKAPASNTGASVP